MDVVKWDKQKISSRDKRSEQLWLLLQTKKLFPGEEIVEDFHHAEISRKSGCNVEFDVFLPERRMALEYHGEQHYHDTPGAGFAPLEMYQRRDVEKQEICSKNNITLVVVPYWWDGTLEQLKYFLNYKF